MDWALWGDGPWFVSCYNFGVMSFHSSNPAPGMSGTSQPDDAAEKLQKNVSVARLLETRIRDGEYGATALPAERELATELGVSRVTIRRVLHDLESRKVLKRLANRRLVSAFTAKAGSSQSPMAILMPSMVNGVVSSDQMQWYHALAAVAMESDQRVQLHHYFNWGDRIVTEVLRDFEHIFLIPSAEAMSPEVRALIEEKSGLVSLSVDMTDFNVPSILSFRPEDVDRVLEHLGNQGYSRMDCLNVQGRDSVINYRIQRWREWLADHDLRANSLRSRGSPAKMCLAWRSRGRARHSRKYRSTPAPCSAPPSPARSARSTVHRGGHRPRLRRGHR